MVTICGIPPKTLKKNNQQLWIPKEQDIKKTQIKQSSKQSEAILFLVPLQKISAKDIIK